MNIMIMKTGLIIIAIASAVVASPFSQEERDPALRALSASNNAFTVDLYKRLVKDGENLVTSPFSVLTVLAMLFEGAGGNSARQIRQATRLNNANQDDWERAFHAMIESLKEGEGHELSVANSVWVLKSFQVLEGFRRKLSEIFDAEERQLNLATAVSDVNQWVDFKTKHKIPNLLSEVPDETVMILLNAIYFKGTWAAAFNKSQNTQETFHNNDLAGGKAITTFMNIDKRLLYVESDELNAQIVEIPYKGDDMKMLVFLPKTGSTLAQMEQKLTPVTLENAVKGMYREMVQLSLPKFKIESDIDLVEPLKAMGLRDVFTPLADLRGISPNSPLTVSKVLQKATIDVNEEGSEAAAATAIFVALRTAHFNYFDDPVQFKANHPFLYALYHEPTKSFVFMGRYVKA